MDRVPRTVEELVKNLPSHRIPHFERDTLSFFHEDRVPFNKYALGEFVVLDRLSVKVFASMSSSSDRPLKEVFEYGKRVGAQFVARNSRSGHGGHYYFFRAKDPIILEKEIGYRID